MDAKLNPISSSAAGVPLSVESSLTQGKQADTNTKLNAPTIQDTLETSDREGDGRQPVDSSPSQSKNAPDDVSNDTVNEKPVKNETGSAGRPAQTSGEGQGSLLDLQG